MPALRGRNKKTRLTSALDRVRSMCCIDPIATTGERVHGASGLVAIQASYLFRRPGCFQSHHVSRLSLEDPEIPPIHVSFNGRPKIIQGVVTAPLIQKIS